MTQKDSPVNRSGIPAETPLDTRATANSDPDATLGSSQASSISPLDGTIVNEPTTIGPYKLVRRLGEGGMGQVWLAEQTEPVSRTVAVKLIRVGLYDAEVLERFRAERQSLALMDHPAIAKVFEAGATPGGQPYFVMEYVPGAPITRYCDDKRLTIRQRLELFTKVCEGVQHAHQKAIIHRDLKPPNILVAETDGKPVPRIIDFGLAKETGPQIGDETVMTRAGGWVGTPGYMSPEQASGGRDVDTRTDVYSLGVVLYELLTGDQPFDKTKWKTRPFHEVLRQLQEIDPPRPSSKIRMEKSSSPSSAELRSVQSKQLERLLRGDLDWITLKALEKDRARRYGSPEKLAGDVERYLKNEPIVARPASTAYRLRKYVRRHRIGVSAVSAFVLLLAGFFAMQVVQIRRVTRERDRANRITDFMTQIFKVSEPGEARGNSVTARELLDSASTKINSELTGDPELRAEMMETMGRVYLSLGLYSRAQSLLEHTVQIRNEVLGPEDAATLNARSLLAADLTRQGRNADAEKMVRDTLLIQRRVLGVAHRDTLSSMNDLISALTREGKLAEAEQMALDGLQLARRSLPANDQVRISMLNNLGLLFKGQGKYQDAEQTFRELAEILQHARGPDDPATLTVKANLIWALQDLNRLAEAEQLQREILESERRVFGPEHPEYLRSMNLLGRTLRHLGRYNEAEKLHLQALEVQRRVLKPGNPDLSWTLELLGFARTMGGHYSDARESFLEAIANAKVGQSQPTVALAWYNFACGAALAGKNDEALHNLQEAIAENYGGSQEIAKDDDLKSLNDDPRFRRIISDLRQREAMAREAAGKKPK